MGYTRNRKAFWGLQQEERNLGMVRQYDVKEMLFFNLSDGYTILLSRGSLKGNHKKKQQQPTWNLAWTNRKNKPIKIDQNSANNHYFDPERCNLADFPGIPANQM